MDSINIWIGAALLGLAAYLNTDATVGAFFGGMFFMLDQDHHPWLRRIAYAAISVCVGYGAGLAAPESWAMLAAATSSAVAVVALSSLVGSINRDGIRAVLDTLRGGRK